MVEEPGFKKTVFLGGIEPDARSETWYGNFDIILDHFSRISQLVVTPHARCPKIFGAATDCPGGGIPSSSLQAGCDLVTLGAPLAGAV